MLTEEEVKGKLRKEFRPYAAYITEIANAYVTRGANPEKVAVCLDEAAKNLRAITPQAYRDSFMNLCDDEFNDVLGDGISYEDLVQIRRGIMAIKVPPLVAVAQPTLVDYYALHEHDLDRLRKLRTEETIKHGRALALAAVKMEDWFHWVQSGPTEPGFGGALGLDYGPKVKWTMTRTDVGIEHHDEKQNDFAAWLFGTKGGKAGPEPNSQSSMNCWEAVLFSAYRARLVDKYWLRAIHGKAAFAYAFQHKQVNFAGNQAYALGENYFQALSDAFGFRNSVPFEPRAGLIPKTGDILFWDRDQHVAVYICGSLSVKNGEVTHYAMSLWHDNNKRFARVPLENWSRYLEKLRFLPCPFNPALMGGHWH
jgi:hypothetical protein